MFRVLRQHGIVQVLQRSARDSRCPKSSVRALIYQSPSISPSSSSALRSFHISSILQSQAAFPVTTAQSNAPTAHGELEEPAPQAQITQFSDLGTHGLVDREIIGRIHKMGITTMTDVQRLTIPEILQGKDVVAQARTGTGKTLAFLVPVLQNVLRSLHEDQPQRDLDLAASRYRRRRHVVRRDIRALVISPTRELAEQIATEARKIASGTDAVVQTAVGGTQKRLGLMRIQREGCNILIATPGRLQDLLEDPTSGLDVSKLNTLVLDEADRLLDDGFAPDIERIQSMLPDPGKVDRQTLMFSATMPRQVFAMVRQSMKPDYKFLKTVRDDEIPTHLSVPQRVVFLNGWENGLPTLLEIVKRAVSQTAENPDAQPFKAIVYFGSTLQTTFAHEVFDNLLVDPENMRSGSPLRGIKLIQLQSRLSQHQRTCNSRDFRNARSAILFSSDVTARGMDFPGVTHVIQFGLPQTKETYIHRLGRTARANKSGEGWLLVHDAEYDACHHLLNGIPITQEKGMLETPDVNIPRDPDLSTSSPMALECISQIRAATTHVSPSFRKDAYKSLVSPMRRFLSPRRLVRVLNDLAVHGYGLPQPPPLSSTFARHLGLANVPGLSIGSDGDDGNHEYSARGRSSLDSRFRSRSREHTRGWQGRRGGDRYSSYESRKPFPQFD